MTAAAALRLLLPTAGTQCLAPATSRLSAPTRRLDREYGDS